jgi:hypothetical protein
MAFQTTLPTIICRHQGESLDTIMLIMISSMMRNIPTHMLIDTTLSFGILRHTGTMATVNQNGPFHPIVFQWSCSFQLMRPAPGHMKRNQPCRIPLKIENCKGAWDILGS